MCESENQTMAKNVNTNTIDTNNPAFERIRNIANDIRQMCNGITSYDLDKADLTAQAKAAGEAAMGAREGIMQRIAQMSVASNLTEAEVRGACALAASMGNDKTDKSVSTFIADVKRAAHPNVRDRFDTLFALRNDAWEMEQLDKEGGQPIKKAFKRKYHALNAVLTAVLDGVTLDSVADFVAYAEARDPDLDPKKVKARLDKIRDDLAAFVQTFPVGDLAACVDLIGAITVKELTDSRAPKVVAPVTTKPRAVARAQTAQTTKPAPVASVASVAEGASNVVEDVMAGLAA
jgi:hypothetical protein